MENISNELASAVQSVEGVKTQKKREKKVEEREKEIIVPVQKVDEANAIMEKGEGGVPLRPAASVLTERSNDNNTTSSTTTLANTANKMVSPVLLKLRRNQERRVTPANPVDPVQVPPKHFQGFPADRYMSPTDSIMSPISRGLLARSRRSTRLPPAFVPPKVLDHTFQDADHTNSTSS